MQISSVHPGKLLIQRLRYYLEKAFSTNSEALVSIDKSGFLSVVTGVGTVTIKISIFFKSSSEFVKII